MNTGREPDARVAALRAARTQDSQDKGRRVLTALHAMEKAGTPVTAAKLAAAAGVSTWLVYADGVHEHLDAARRRQPSTRAFPSPPTPHLEVRQRPWRASRTDLAIARAEFRRLRAEHDKLRSRLRLHLGAEIEGPDRANLIARVAQVEAAARQLLTERDARTAEADHPLRQIRELEDNLTAARESLRRVIRETNT